jgi:CDP-diacylglycerol--glycerol-3-phosphate 3-phosphatidyltransferase
MVYLLPFNIVFINFFLAILFLLFGLTDFFDGYYARKWGQVTQLGATLDPIADKFLLCATLISLIAAQKIYFYWVVILIGREFFVMGLRSIASERHFSIPVSWFAKIKTTVEIFYIAFVIGYIPSAQVGFFHFYNMIYYGLLWSTLGLSLFTAYRYYIYFITHINHIETKEHVFYDNKM